MDGSFDKIRQELAALVLLEDGFEDLSEFVEIQDIALVGFLFLEILH